MLFQQLFPRVFAACFPIWLVGVQTQITVHFFWQSVDAFSRESPAWQWLFAEHPVPWFARTHAAILPRSGISIASTFASEDPIFFDH